MIGQSHGPRPCKFASPSVVEDDYSERRPQNVPLHIYFTRLMIFSKFNVGGLCYLSSQSVVIQRWGTMLSIVDRRSRLSFNVGGLCYLSSQSVVIQRWGTMLSIVAVGCHSTLGDYVIYRRSRLSFNVGGLCYLSSQSVVIQR